MRALVEPSREYGQMQLVDLERPEPAPGEALIEVDYAGLCGSDAGIYKFKSAFERMALPTVIGHEYTGRVVEVGADVTSFEPGDRVVERPIRGCGSCYQYRIGEENARQDAAITGVDHDGAYAEFISVPAAALQHVPAASTPTPTTASRSPRNSASGRSTSRRTTSSRRARLGRRLDAIAPANVSGNRSF